MGKAVEGDAVGEVAFPGLACFLSRDDPLGLFGVVEMTLPPQIGKIVI